MRPWILCVGASVLLAIPAQADTFTETFDGGSNVGGWTFGGPIEFIADDGGNPGAYLRTEDLDTFAPWPHTALNEESVFTGDYRVMNVESIGVDLRTFYVDFSAEDRALALMLQSDNDTPDDPSDDWFAYTLGPDAPTPDDGWMSYDFEVPSQSADWPAGWDWFGLGNAPPDPTWEDMIADVDGVLFAYGDPTWFYIFQMWDLGLDNPRITTGGVATQSTTLGDLKASFR